MQTRQGKILKGQTQVQSSRRLERERQRNVEFASAKALAAVVLFLIPILSIICLFSALLTSAEPVSCQAIAVAPGSKEGLPALPPDNVLFPTTAGWALLNFQQSGPRSSFSCYKTVPYLNGTVVAGRGPETAAP
jgi:hypothetical protein